MTNNYILRRLRYTFDFNDSQVIELCALGGLTVSRELISNWLKKDDHKDYVRCTDNQFAIFLNGLIIDRRGAQDGSPPKAEYALNNNIILRKLKIALNFKDDDMLEALDNAGFRMSKHELSALFRKPDHRSYRECQDQFLRNFLKGIQLKFRNETDIEDEIQPDRHQKSKIRGKYKEEQAQKIIKAKKKENPKEQPKQKENRERSKSKAQSIWGSKK